MNLGIDLRSHLFTAFISSEMWWFLTEAVSDFALTEHHSVFTVYNIPFCMLFIQPHTPAPVTMVGVHTSALQKGMELQDARAQCTLYFYRTS